MSQSFFLRSIDSDLTVGGALFNRKLLEDTNTAASQVVSLAQNETIDGYAWTEPGLPGVDGGAGDYTVSVHVIDGATQINISTRLARVDSSGVVQAEGDFSTPDPGNAGVKIHTFEAFDFGTWNVGDRLRVQYRFVNTDNMMARSLTIEKNTVETEVITPWDSGVAEASGTVTAVGSLSATGSAPAAIPEASGTVTVVGSVAAVGHTTPVASGSTVAVGSLVAVGDAPTVGVAASGTVSAVGTLSATGETPEGAMFDPPDLAVTVNGTTAELVWSASPTPGVADYQVFRRTPPSGVVFDPQVDTPIASGITLLEYDDEGLAPGDFEYQIYGRIPA